MEFYDSDDDPCSSLSPVIRNKAHPVISEQQLSDHATEGGDTELWLKQKHSATAFTNLNSTLNDFQDKVDPVAIKRERIMHKSKYCWQPSFAFVPDSLKATR